MAHVAADGIGLNSESKARGHPVIGALLVLVGLAVNKWTLERVFSHDEYISSMSSIMLIAAFDATLLLAGLWLLLKRPTFGISLGLRRLLALVLLGGVAIGVYGALKVAGVIDPYREQRAAWATMAASEELIFEVTPQFKKLAGSLNNMKFPDHLSLEVFEAKVAFIDLVAMPAVPKIQQIADTGIEVPEWAVGKEVKSEPIAGVDLWRPFMEKVEYVNFPWTEFKAAKAKFLDESHTTFEINLVFQGVARLKSGGWAWAKAANEVRWRKQPQGDSREPAKWKIYEWRTVKFTTMERNELMFGEVLDVVLPADVAAAAKRSIHEEMRLAWILAKEKKDPHPHFTLESVDRHPGVAIVDLDGDGFDDIYFLADYGKNMFFRNRGDGTFEEISAKLGLDLEGKSSSAIFADFDNDGHLDVFIGRTLARSVYMHWENGRFVDRSAWIGGELPFFASSVSAADYDGDGLLDVYIATYASNITYWEKGVFDPEALKPYLNPADIAELQRRMAAMDNPFADLPGPPNVLLHNLGGGKFEVVKDSALNVFRNTYQATWGDFDGDGRPDIFLANDFSPPTLFRNLGGGKFADVSAQMGLTNARFGMGATWGDYDQDGRMDLYVSAMSSKAGRRIIAQLPKVDPRFAVMAAGNALYHNEPGKFEKTSGPSSPKLTVEQSGWDWGAQLVDLNNDGFLDIFSLSGYFTAPKQVETDFDL